MGIFLIMRIILVESQEPGNIGSAARVMKNFGLSDLVLLRPKKKLNQQAYDFATHAKDVLLGAKRVETFEEAAKDIKIVLATTARLRTSDAYDIYSPREAAKKFRREDIAVMFGPESSGLKNSDLDRAQAFIKIPTSEFSSLNLAQAVNLISYEFFTSQVDEGNIEQDLELASRDELEHFYAHFMESMYYIGYTDDERARLTEHMYRRIYDRARLSKKELIGIYGFFRQIRWAADQDPSKFPIHKKSQ